VLSRLSQPLAALVLAFALLGTVGCVDKPTEHRVRANAYLRAGEAKSALAECDMGLQESPKDSALLILRGKALFELLRYKEAAKDFKSAIEAGKDLDKRALSEAQLGLAMVAMRTEDFPEAKSRFAKLVEANPKDGDARINLARVCLQLKDTTCAIEQGEAAGKLRGNDEGVLFTLGRIYLVAGKYDDARKTFERICTVAKNAASCPYGVALVLAQQGDKPGALKKLREAIALKLPNPEQLSDDPLLAPLKDDDEFKKLASASAK
jgi:tetratricopeptide (TPR) repeat protein